MIRIRLWIVTVFLALTLIGTSLYDSSTPIFDSHKQNVSTEYNEELLVQQISGQLVTPTPNPCGGVGATHEPSGAGAPGITAGRTPIPICSTVIPPKPKN